MLRTVVAVLVVAALTGACGDDSATLRNQPLPVLLAISPDTVEVGATGPEITLQGENFTRESRARWNDQDRVTRFDGASRLVLVLTPDDVAHTVTGRITVHNPPPAGGTSGVLTLHIVNPRPVVTSVHPDTIFHDDTVQFTVIGRNFMPESRVAIGSLQLETTSLSSTQLTARRTSSVPLAPGTQPLRVITPAPGGGISNTYDIVVRNRAAVVDAVAPDSVATDDGPLTLVVTGSGFVTGATLRWNGAERATTVANSTRLQAQLTAADVTVPGVFTVTVHNPLASASNAVQVRVTPAPPRISSISPISVVAGSGPVTVTITGRNFTAATTGEWNGNTRPTTVVSATQLRMEVHEGDVSLPTTGRITVRDFGNGLVSAATPFAVLDPDVTITVRQVALVANDIVYDSVARVIYASVPNTADRNPNAIAIIEPVDGVILSYIPDVGSNPGRLAVSDDGRYLYVALLGASQINRIDLLTGARDITIQLPAGQLVEDMLVLRGSPRTVIASLRNTCCSPRHTGVLAWDDTVRRALTTQGHTGSNRITAGATAAAIFGYNNETTEFGFRRIAVTAAGLQEVETSRGLLQGFGLDIESDGNYAYSTAGDVVDLVTLTRFGTIPVRGLVTPDAAKGRVHYLESGSRLWTYHTSNLAPIGNTAVPLVSGATVMIRWGTNGLAVRTPGEIVLVRSSLVGP